jgi:hypothetical protein
MADSQLGANLRCLTQQQTMTTIAIISKAPPTPTTTPAMTATGGAENKIDQFVCDEYKFENTSHLPGSRVTWSVRCITDIP